MDNILLILMIGAIILLLLIGLTLKKSMKSPSVNENAPLADIKPEGKKASSDMGISPSVMVLGTRRKGLSRVDSLRKLPMDGGMKDRLSIESEKKEQSPTNNKKGIKDSPES